MGSHGETHGISESHLDRRGTVHHVGGSLGRSRLVDKPAEPTPWRGTGGVKKVGKPTWKNTPWTGSMYGILFPTWIVDSYGIFMVWNAWIIWIRYNPWSNNKTGLLGSIWFYHFYMALGMIHNIYRFEYRCSMWICQSSGPHPSTRPANDSLEAISSTWIHPWEPVCFLSKPSFFRRVFFGVRRHMVMQYILHIYTTAETNIAP